MRICGRKFETSPADGVCEHYKRIGTPETYFALFPGG